MGARRQAMFLLDRPPSGARLVATSVVAFAALVCVLVVIQDTETARETSGLQAYQQPVLATPNVQMQISQQLRRYDMAIKRVDEDISQSKMSLVKESQKLGQATQLAVALHNKLVHDHQALLSEAARSRAMKQLRSQLAAKQTVVVAERQKLQVDALQLAEIEQHARVLLSPKYTPNQQELQAVAQEAHISPPPPLSLMQRQPAGKKAASSQD